MPKTYSVRKAGMRRGEPHYSVECNKCCKVLAIGHLSKPAADKRGSEHTCS